MHALHKLLLATALTTVAYSADLDVGIVNGRKARAHSKPYMVSVQKNGRHICGGFLVSEYFVMTAAHCKDRGKKLTVVLGAHDISKLEKSSHNMSVKSYKIHPEYNPKTYENDILLLQLNGEAPKSNAVHWISLPQQDEDVEDKSICNVAGWGANKQGKTTATAHLLEANVRIVGRESCQNLWKNTNITSFMLCTGGKAGICKGDSGGPLVCKGTAVGVVSFFDGNCKKDKKPNVYTKISKYLSWIKDIIGSIK